MERIAVLACGRQASPLVMQVRAKLDKTKGEPFTMQTMAMIRNMIEGW